MGKSQLQELKGLEKENSRLKRIVADLELDKLILRESPDDLVISPRLAAEPISLSFVPSESVSASYLLIWPSPSILRRYSVVSFKRIGT